MTCTCDENIHCFIDKNCTEHGKKNILDCIAYMIYLESWAELGESTAEFCDSLLIDLRKTWLDGWIPALEQEHDGDCTNQPYTCMRCSMNEIYRDAEKLLNTF